MRPLWALLPWRDDDPRHNHYEYTPLLPRIAEDDPRAQGPTMRVPMYPTPLPDDFAWTGGQTPSKTAVKQREERRLKCEQEGKPFCEPPPRYDLPVTIWKHPWFWKDDDGMPLGALGFYERKLLTNQEMIDALPTLYNKKLPCWCRRQGQKCHVDILVRYANAYGYRAPVPEPNTLL
jgi:hypothetical protein